MNSYIVNFATYVFAMIGFIVLILFVYKKAMSYEDAEEYIISQSGEAFDPKVVNTFMNVKEKLRNINEKYKESDV